MTNEELARKLASLEARVAKLEASGIKPLKDREYIVAHKKVDQTLIHYWLTSQDRILEWRRLEKYGDYKKDEKGNYVTDKEGRNIIEDNPTYLEILRTALLAEGDDMILDEKEGNLVNARKVFAKYVVDPCQPALVGNVVLTNDESMRAYIVQVTTKKIKFN